MPDIVLLSLSAALVFSECLIADVSIIPSSSVTTTWLSPVVFDVILNAIPESGSFVSKAIFLNLRSALRTFSSLMIAFSPK